MSLLRSPRGTQLARVALMIAAITAVARLAGFGRTVVFGRSVGRTCLGTVYAAANGVPNILFEIVAGGALAAVVVPLLARRFASADLDGASRTASALLTWTVIALVPVLAITALAARPIVSALLGPAAGCDRAAAVTVGTRMLLVFVVQIVLYGVGVVVGGVLQAAGRFLGPAIAPLLSSVVVIVSYAAFDVSGPAVTAADLGGLSPGREALLAGGTTLGVVVLTLSLLLPLRRVGIRLRPTLRFAAGEGRTVAALALAGLATVAAQQAVTALVIRLSNEVRADSYVVHLLALTVFLLPWAVLAVPIATSVFPRVAAATDATEIGDVVAGALRAVTVLMCLSTAVLVAVAAPAAAVLLLGAPGQGSAAPTALAAAMVAFAPGLLGYGVWAVAARVLFARRAAGMAAAGTVAGWVVVAGADVLLVQDATGESIAARLAAGQSIGLSVAGVLTVLAVRRIVPGCVAGLARTFAIGCCAALAGGLAGSWLAGSWHAGTAIEGVVISISAAVVVLAVAVAVVAMLDRSALTSALRAVRRG